MDKASETKAVRKALDEMNGRGVTKHRAMHLVGADVNGVTRQIDFERGKEFVKVELLFRLPIAQDTAA